MNTTFVDRRMHSLALARACLAFGARARSISFISGLSRNDTYRILAEAGESPKQGNHPGSPEWLYKSNLFAQIEASTFASIYRRYRGLGVGESDSLIAAFGRYQTLFRTFRHLTFDRAFNITCHLDGIWVSDRRNLSLVACGICGSHNLSTIVADKMSTYECLFCKIRRRYENDKRLRENFPERQVPELQMLQHGLFAPLFSKKLDPTAPN